MNYVPTVTEKDSGDDLLELPAGLLLRHAAVGHQVVWEKRTESVHVAPDHPTGKMEGGAGSPPNK